MFMVNIKLKIPTKFVLIILDPKSEFYRSVKLLTGAKQNPSKANITQTL